MISYEDYFVTVVMYVNSLSNTGVFLIFLPCIHQHSSHRFLAYTIATIYNMGSEIRKVVSRGIRLFLDLRGIYFMPHSFMPFMIESTENLLNIVRILLDVLLVL
ncbi:unnamed protein product [Dracunculus medinensis]|uniref:Uncharacterized protein n=1 Tax=Dracunculus medinensis TaxID=318479 RepID=A0A0N4UL94_DRAME|nr:unnamed protein product [Dracunculus medinensis]